jgi:hypothetical protein
VATARDKAAGARGTDKCHKSASAALLLVRKGKPEVGESKKEQDKLVKTACPWGRMRGETPKREWDKSEAGRK